MKQAAKFSDLVSALEFSSEEHVTVFDRQTGRIVSVERFVLAAVEEGDEKSLSSLADWQREEVELARAMIGDQSNRFIEPPDRFEFHEYRHMERFIQSVPDDAGADELWRAIKGRGAFRCFKDAARRLGLLEQWFQYRDKAMTDFVREWAKDNDVAVEDDTSRGHSRPP